MIKRLDILKNTVNKYMADIRPDRLTTCHSERKSVVSRGPSVFSSAAGSCFMELIYDTNSTYNSEVTTYSQDQLKLRCRAMFRHCVT
jgi:hypothetical protein